MAVLRTARLVLRGWTDEDYLPFAAMNADPRVMEHFPAPLTRDQSDGFADFNRANIAERGWGLWAVEVEGGAPFIGFVGLHPVSELLPCAPATEIGWRLAAPHWRKGYATEAARRVLAYAFEDLGLDEVVSFTAVVNEPSQRVMVKIGMRRDLAGDFDHPRVPEGHPVRPHVLYRIARDDWEASI